MIVLSVWLVTPSDGKIARIRFQIRFASCSRQSVSWYIQRLLLFIAMASNAIERSWDLKPEGLQNWV